MNVASPTLCEELYDLSDCNWGGWSGPDTDYVYVQKTKGFIIDGPDDFPPELVNSSLDKDPVYWWVPAYDLGYLLRKLPHETTLRKSIGDFEHDYIAMHRIFNGVANTPEDAVAKLTIELIKVGVVTS